MIKIINTALCSLDNVRNKVIVVLFKVKVTMLILCDHKPHPKASNGCKRSRSLLHDNFLWKIFKYKEDYLRSKLLVKVSGVARNLSVYVYISLAYSNHTKGSFIGKFFYSMC